MNLKTLAALIALSLPLAGCGNKGPLVLPSAPVPDEAPATEPVPVDDVTEPEALIDSAPEADADTGVDAGSNDDAASEPPPRATAR